MKTVVKWLASWLNIDYEEKWRGGGGALQRRAKNIIAQLFVVCSMNGDRNIL